MSEKSMGLSDAMERINHLAKEQKSEGGSYISMNVDLMIELTEMVLKDQRDLDHLITAIITAHQIIGGVKHPLATHAKSILKCELIRMQGGER